MDAEYSVEFQNHKPCNRADLVFKYFENSSKSRVLQRNRNLGLTIFGNPIDYFYSLFEYFIAYEMSYAYSIDSNTTMETFTASAARKELYRLMDKTAESHEPVKITGKRNNVVMVSEEDWNAVSETIYLNSVPGLAEEILKRRDSEDADFVKDEEMDW